MQNIIDDLAQLTSRISRDRDVYTYGKDVILMSHVIGDGFVKNHNNDETDDETDGELSITEGNNKPDESRTDQDANGTEDSDEDRHSSTEADCEEAITWLNNLGDIITSLHQAPAAGKPTPCPHLIIDPRDFQYAALQKIEHSCSSPLRAVMIGDPPGLGKTLPAMMAVVKAKANSTNNDKLMFSIIVVPASCLEQWRQEFGKFFAPGAVSVFVLADSNTSPLELLKYDVIITSYAFIMNQYRKLQNYTAEVASFKKNGNDTLPERPSISIFADILYDQDLRSPYLVLDEINAAKNPDSITFAAVKELQLLARATIMLTGSPLDNTWVDLFSFMQFVSNHSIDSMPKMLQIFGNRAEGGRILPPKDKTLRRLLQALNAFVVRRPADTVDLPALQEEVVTFYLSEEEADTSNESFRRYKKIMNINAAKGRREGSLPWIHLTRSMQDACHPMLKLIMHIAHNPLANNDDQATADLLFEAEDIEAWSTWREKLKEDENWRSSRITALIDVLNTCRDVDPTCSILIFDESVYFLDIIQTALSHMPDPVECLRYDGREIPDRRTAILQDFDQAGGRKVLLISRAAGGVGLNITTANIVILCEPWWKQEWEVQAIKRAHRTGQRRDVLAIRLSAENCELDCYKGRTRDKKHVHNSHIIQSITRKDGVVPAIWDDLE